MKNVTAYVHLNGTTKDAMNFYKGILGGDVRTMTVGQSSMSAEMKAQMPPGSDDRIMHASLMRNGTPLLYAADMMDPSSFKAGDTYSVCVDCDSADEARSIYRKLAEGGKVNYDIMEVPWGGVLGTCTDKFGVDWMVNYSEKK